MAKLRSEGDDPSAEQLPADRPDGPEATPPIVEYPKWVKRLDDDGHVVEEILVQNEDEEKAVKVNWAKEDKKAE